MSITVNSGDMGQMGTLPFSMSISYRIQNFAIADSTGSQTVNGDMRIDLTVNSDHSESMTVTGGSLNSASGTHSVVLKNYTVTMNVSGSGISQTVGGTVETTNARLGGTVSYQITTVTPFIVNSSGSLAGGAIKLTGNGSAMLVTVTGTDTFKLEVDGNGDGGYETTLTSTRSELDSLL
jgi:hypothetical protein